MQWSAVVDYHALLKQECSVWVTMDCKHAFLCRLLLELMSEMGEVLVSPHANAANKCKFCVLWDTSRKRPRWVRMHHTYHSCIRNQECFNHSSMVNTLEVW